MRTGFVVASEAPQRARQLAEQTGTDLVVVRAMPDLHESNYK